MSQDRELSRLELLLVSPLPPPSGGIATYTESLLKQSENYSNVGIQLVDSAVRWRRPLNLNPLARLVGGSIQAMSILRQTGEKVTSQRPNVVHVSTSGGPGFLRDFLVLKFLQRIGIPSLLHIHMGRLPVLLSGSSLQAKLARTTLRQATAIAVLDEPSRLAVKCLDNRMSVEKIPNFVDVSDIEKLTSDEPPGAPGRELLFVGHVIPSKGALDLVNACAPIRGISLRLIGPIEQEFERQLRDVAARHDLRLQIDGVLPREAVIRAMRRAGVLALPSYSEGFPYVILEAMTLAKPIIATPVGAIPEILQFDSAEPCGREVRVGDIENLRAAVVDSTTNVDKWRAMGRRGWCRLHGSYSSRVAFPRLVDLWFSIAYTSNVKDRTLA